jgi:hypothetical protein
MSIILDALRRGRGRQAPGPHPNTAQADAVLHTLGYGRTHPAARTNRVTRKLVYAAVVLLLTVALGLSMMWLGKRSSPRALPREGAAAYDARNRINALSAK